MLEYQGPAAHSPSSPRSALLLEGGGGELAKGAEMHGGKGWAGKRGDPQQGKGTGRSAEAKQQLLPPSSSLRVLGQRALWRPFVKAEPGGMGVGLGERRGPGTKMSRAGSGAHTHSHTSTRCPAHALA